MVEALLSADAGYGGSKCLEANGWWTRDKVQTEWQPRTESKPRPQEMIKPENRPQRTENTKKKPNVNTVQMFSVFYRKYRILTFYFFYNFFWNCLISLSRFSRKVKELTWLWPRIHTSADGFLTARSHHVKVNDVLSDALISSSGSPDVLYMIIDFRKELNTLSPVLEADIGASAGHRVKESSSMCGFLSKTYLFTVRLWGFFSYLFFNLLVWLTNLKKEGLHIIMRVCWCP